MLPTCMLSGLMLALAGLPLDTLTVDDDGPADFHSIAAAVAAATPGDVILVEPGTYAPFTLTIDLTVLGRFGEELPGWEARHA